jgi:Pyruvate phosphate dikinase, AMP/ATP-binding domain
MSDEGFETFSVRTRPKVLAIHLELLQYPILCDIIRRRMREELYNRGIIDVSTLEHEIRDKAIKSQRRERLDDPLTQESEDNWQKRLSRIKATLTEFYFALNFTHTDFMRIVQEVLAHQGPAPSDRIFLSFNPEIAPWKMLFAQAKQIEASSPEKRHALRHHLREIIVVLTKGMLSDQLSFVKIAKDNFSTRDLEAIYRRRVGRGKIGGKAGGMMLAKAILHRPHEDDPVDFRDVVRVPDSYFLGSDVLYEFLEANNLGDTVNLKYMTYEEIKEEYPRILRKYMMGRIPEPFRDRLRLILEEVGDAPLIVRSSSLLEDNFGISFAGKYDSFFCPNQGAAAANLEALTSAIKKVYASLLSPDAVIYRQQKDLIDYDERMAILIQRVVGQRFGKHHFPVIAGVGFSYNPFQWNPRIDRDAGFLRIVTGLGTRAVDRLSSDYAQMVALSHPTLRPVKNTEEVVQYSQQEMDVINLETDKLETVPVRDVLNDSFPHLKHVGSILSEGSLHAVLIRGPGTIEGDIVVTYASLLKNKRFVRTMRAMLRKLARHYGAPVDIEFTIDLKPGKELDFRVVLLQCRQQSRRAQQEECAIPEEIAERDILLDSRRMVSSGRIEGVRYVVYVDPEDYREIDNRTRQRLGKVIGQINTAITDEPFILIGPGRWGSSNIELGVPVAYGQIYNARALVEIALPHGDVAPEASYGTHFFQDLVESNTLPLPIYPGEKGAFFNYRFFRACRNVLPRFAKDVKGLAAHIKVIDLHEVTGGRRLEIVMNPREERAVGFLTAAQKPEHVEDLTSWKTGEYKRITREFELGDAADDDEEEEEE